MKSEKSTWTKWDISQDRNHKKESDNSRAEEFNDWNAKCKRENLQHSRTNGRLNKWPRRECFSNNPVQWDSVKCTNTSIIRVPEGEKRRKGPESLFNI